MPFVRAIAVRARPGHVDRLIAHVRQDLQEEEPVAGMRGLHALRDVQDQDAGLLITFFETREAMEANTANMQAEFAVLEPLLAGPPSITVYEVVAERALTS